MPATPHVEAHFTGSRVVRDVVIGMSDGLTVPFALAAGLSAAVGSSHVVVTAGLAEVAAGAVAMGLGGFLAARTDQEHYRAEERRELSEIEDRRGHEIDELKTVFRTYGLDGRLLDNAARAIAADKSRWAEFMLRFELGLERPDPRHAPTSAVTIAGAYIAGGLVPLLPFMATGELRRALAYSIGLTAAALLGFGAVKGRFTGVNPLKSGLQTLLVGGIAAAAAFYLASLFA